MRPYLVLLTLVLLTTSAAARGTTGTPPPPRAVFRQLFPEPTGRNGYEEIVMAGDLVAGSETIAAASARGSTLAAKRAALSDPKNRRALVLLRRGLAKPIRSPRQEWTADTLFPDLALVRQLARLLAIEQYVLLADGKTGGAVDSLRDGLRMGQAIKSEILFGALVGRAVDSIVLAQVGRHMEQLSVADCTRLLALVRGYLSTPDATITSFVAERRIALSSMDAFRQNPISILRGFPSDESGSALAREIRAVAQDPAAVESLARDGSALINAYFEPHIAALRLPPWKRGELPTRVIDRSLAGRLVAMILPRLTRVEAMLTRSRVQVQLLGVHTAIRRYRWEQNRLPNLLSDLRLDSLVIDPYTGTPLVYRRMDETAYELSSVGPPKRTENGDEVPGQREPISLLSQPLP